MLLNGLQAVNLLLTGELGYRNMTVFIKDISCYLPQQILSNEELAEVANTVIYLLSDASRWVTGSNLVIDGGITLI